MKTIFHPRWVRRTRRMVLLAVALPLMQLGACQTAIGQSALLVTPQVPSIIINTIGSALLETLFSLIGTSTQALFGGTNTTGS